MHVKGLELPGYEPRTLHAMALGLAVNARGADHNRSGAYEADLSGDLDRLDGGDEHVAAAIETEDRAAAMDSLILCKFLRGVFADPWEEWAALLRPITGWDGFDGAELHDAARGIVAAKHAFNRREGWTREEDTLPGAAARRPAHAAVRPRGGAHARAAGRDGRRLPPRARTGHICPRPTCCGADMALTVPPKTDAPAVTCTIDGVEVTVPNGTTIYTAAQGGRDRHPGALPRRALRPGRRLPHVRGRRRRPRARRRLRAALRGRDGGHHGGEKVEQQRKVLTELLMADQPRRTGPEGDDHRRQHAARAGAPL